MSLRAGTLRGGAFLAMREAIGMLVSVAGVLFLTRLIGPGKYGLFAAAMGVYLYVMNLSQWGVAVFLIRGNPESERAEIYDQAFTLLLVLGVGAAVIVSCATPLIASLVHLDGFRPVALILLLVLPVQLTNQVPLARLERKLDYRRVATTELSGQVSYYLVALPVALRGGGVWAPVAGWWAQQVVLSVQLHARSDLRLRLRWERQLVRQMLGYGLGYSASMWVWQARSLVNPIIVGRFAGPVGVGYVALAIRVTEYLCFVKTATYRISIAALGRVQDQIEKLRGALTEGMTLQQLVLGPLLVGFALLGPLIVSRAFGPRWVGMMRVFPLIALAYLTNALFALHSSVLYVRRRNWEVTSFHAAHVVLFATAALLLVPRFGIVGYGIAEICAIPAYFIVHAWVVREAGSPRYTHALIWYACMAMALLGIPRSPAFAIAALVPLLWSPARAELTAFAKIVRERLPRPQAAPDAV